MRRTFGLRKLMLLVTMLLVSSAVWSADVYLYLNSKNPQELTISDARQIMEAKQLSWKNGKSIVLLIPDFKKIDDDAFESFVSMTKSQFLGRWRVKFFSGRARMPVQLPNHEAALNTVRENQEAVYFSFERVTTIDALTGIREEHFAF